MRCLHSETSVWCQPSRDISMPNANFSRVERAFNIEHSGNVKVLRTDSVRGHLVQSRAAAPHESITLRLVDRIDESV